MEKNDIVLESLQAKYRENPDEPGTVIGLVQYYSDLGWYNEAIDLCKTALNIHHNDYTLLLEYGNNCFKKSDFQEALKTFSSITSLKPEKIEGWNNLGIVQLKLGLIEEARDSFSRILQIEPNNSGALLNMGNYYSQKNEFSKAQGLFEMVLESKPDFIDAWFNLGNTLLAQKDYAGAKNAFEKTLRYNPDFVSGIKNLGFVLERMDDPEGALQQYLRAIELNKADTGLWVNAGNVYLHQKKYDDAKRCFLKGIRLAPHSIHGWMGLRHLALVKGDITTFIRSTLAILPRLSEDILAQSIEILFNLNQIGKAEEILTQADRLGCSGDSLDLQRLLVYQRRNIQNSRMLSIYKRLSDLPEKTDQVKKCLARYSLHNKNYDEALQYVNQLEEQDRTAQSILWRALVAKNELVMAKQLVQKHIKEDPDYYDCWFVLARIEASRGNRIRAERFLIRALENGFTNTEEINECHSLKEIFDSLTVAKECLTM